MEESQQIPAPRDPVPPTSEADDTDLAYTQALVNILSYISILVVIAYVLAKNPHISKFHLRQGIALFICEALVMVVNAIIPFFFYFSWIFDIALLALSVVGIIHALRKKEVALPFISDVTRLINL